MKILIFGLVLVVQSIAIIVFEIPMLPAAIIGVLVGILSGLLLFGHNEPYRY